MPKRNSVASGISTFSLYDDKDDNDISDSDDVILHFKFSDLLRYLKILFLFAVWVAIVVLFSSSEAGALDLLPHLYAVPPFDTKVIDVPVKHLRKVLGVDVNGPFISTAEFGHLANQRRKHCMMQVQRIFYNKINEPMVTLNVSDMWLVAISDDNIPESLPPVKKTHVFNIYQNVSDDQYTKNILVLKTDIKETIVVKLTFNRSPHDVTQTLLCVGLLFVTFYMQMLWDISERTFPAIFCSIVGIALLTLFNPRPSMKILMEWVHIELLLMLFSLMVMVAVLNDSGIFDYVARHAYEFSNGNIWTLINLLSILIACLSTFLDNVTVMMMAAPVIIRLCELLILDPEIVLTFMLMYANIGASATPVGAPPNLIITTDKFVVEHGISPGNYIIHIAPCTLIVLIVTYFQLHRRFKVIDKFQFRDIQKLREHQRKHRLYKWRRVVSTAKIRDHKMFNQLVNAMLKRTTPHTNVEIMPLTYHEIVTRLRSDTRVRSRIEIIKSIIALVFMMLSYIWFSTDSCAYTYIHLCWVTLLTAILLILFSKINEMEIILNRVEWSTLIFFASTFIIIEVSILLDFLDLIGDMVILFLLSVDPSIRLLVTILVVVWFSALGSCIIGHIAMTTIMLEIIKSCAINNELALPFHPLVWGLSLGASFGGNGALLAATASIITAGIAEKRAYKFNFYKFVRMGFPVVCTSTTIASIYLLIAHCIFEWHDPPIKLNMN